MRRRDNISGGIDCHIPQTGRAQATHHQLGTRGFVTRGGRDARDSDLVIENTRVTVLNAPEKRLQRCGKGADGVLHGRRLALHRGQRVDG
jgi:hypothetical protein